MKCMFEDCTEEALDEPTARGTILDAEIEVFVCAAHRTWLGVGTIDHISIANEERL